MGTSAQVADDLRGLIERRHGAEQAPDRDGLPVLPALAPLIAGGGLRPGAPVSVTGPGAASLALALAAGPSRAGRWCAIVGMPDAGIAAAAGMGVDLARLLLVEAPGGRWPDVVAALADGTALVLVRPAARPSPQVARRLGAVARRHGCVLVVAGPWDDARVRLRVESSEWTGIGDGTGHLQGRRALVTAGRGGAGGGGVGGGPPGKGVWLWLPGADGGVREAAPADGRVLRFRTASGA